MFLLKIINNGKRKPTIPRWNGGLDAERTQKTEKRSMWFLNYIYIPTSKLGFLYKRKKPRASLIFSEFFFLKREKKKKKLTWGRLRHDEIDAQTQKKKKKKKKRILGLRIYRGRGG